MYKIDFEKPIHIHFIGIGGISMSGLAEILLKEGFTAFPAPTPKRSALTDPAGVAWRIAPCSTGSARPISPMDIVDAGRLHGCHPPGQRRSALACK